MSVQREALTNQPPHRDFNKNSKFHLGCKWPSQGGKYGHLHVDEYTYIYLIQNSQAVKIECGPEKGYDEKRCEIQGGGQEMAVMVG